MIIPEKGYTDNPFVDNLIYYAKILALNSTVKDEDEALLYETPESLRLGDLYISCIEQTSRYEMFPMIPKEILAKYIEETSNLDLYVDNPNSLTLYFNGLPIRERVTKFTKISKLARIVYIDHYDTMTQYVNQVGPTWFDDNKELYDKCCSETATYVDLYDNLPHYTVMRIIKQYINNYNGDDMDSVAGTLSDFQQYIQTRTDANIDIELRNVSKAMRCVFKDHYEIMQQRQYINSMWEDGTWNGFVQNKDVYEKCINKSCTYRSLYRLFPSKELRKALETIIGKDTVDKYDLTRDLQVLNEYFKSYSENSKEESSQLTDYMIRVYIENYNMYLNTDIYNRCIQGTMDYYDLLDYIPPETKKIILNTEIEEFTNLEVYEQDKKMLNSFLSTLPKEEADRIKQSINIDMRTWYPENHVEKNNYYRAFLGLPPLDSKGNPYVDTLIHSFDEKNNEFKEFGNKFTRRIPEGIYPDIHWKQDLYLYDDYDVGILKEYGIIDDWLSELGVSINDSRYRYIRYLGDEKLKLYDCRKGLNFQLIGVPTIDDDIAKKQFIHHYAINRDFIIRTVYSDSHKFQSDYYNKFMIIFIIINTIMDMLSEIPELIIDREVFDSRCIKYIFESYGIPYYSEIPVKYQRAMLKNLNILIKYKSSTRNMIDICNLFGFSDIRVFGYYLFKERIVDTYSGQYEMQEHTEISYDLNDLWVRDVNGETIDYNGMRYTKLLQYRNYDEEFYTKEITYQSEDGTISTKRIIKNDAEVYLQDPEYPDVFISLQESDYFTKIKANTDIADLKFIKVPIDDRLTDYKNNPEYILSYDEIVYQDEGDTWDGGLIHEKLRQDIEDYNFNAVKSKYISIETITEMTELSFQVSYFYNMLFDNMWSEEALTVEIPYIKIGHKFRFMDIVCYLFALMYIYNGIEDKIMYSPTQILYLKGYNFNTGLNELLKDARAFSQTEDPMAQEDIFDVNERIKEDNYNYQEAFQYYGIKGFNLDADIDALEKWLNDNYQLSLDDFVIEGSADEFGRDLTLRQFYTLNNSYYQKSIFEDNLLPLPYNQLIKYAFGYTLYEKEIEYDINGNPHEYLIEKEEDESFIIEIIEPYDDIIYVFDNEYFLYNKYAEARGVYYKYQKDDQGVYHRIGYQPYQRKQNTGEYSLIFDGDIYVRSRDNKYIFSADAYYEYDEETEQYVEITDPKHFTQDPYEDGKRLLAFGDYYIYQDGKWVLDPDNCYVLIYRNGEYRYVLLKELGDYENYIIKEYDCYIRHSDGHFVCLTDTDYWRRSDYETDNWDDSDYDWFRYIEEECFVIVDKETEWFDPTVEPRVYYQPLSDYYSENNWLFYRDTYYVKDANGNFIKESDLINPNNCYYLDPYGQYLLVIEHLYSYELYREPKEVKYIMVRQEDYDMMRYVYSEKDTYSPIESQYHRRYVYSSDPEFILVLYEDAIYADTHTMIVVFNKAIDLSAKNEILNKGKYDPEVTDGIWDENDFQYDTPSYESNVLGMSGENKWYYKHGNLPFEEEEAEDVGSGFYLEASSFIGSVEIEKGCKYYMGMDINCNFTGRIQIMCSSDSSCTGAQDRVYDVSAYETLHVSQEFTANEVTRPEIRFLIYDFENYPIEIGDYIAVKNIKFVKAYSDDFVAQDIPSYDQLQKLYRTNDALYKYLVSLMANCSDYRKYQMYKKIYDSLMISEYNKEAFKIADGEYATTYTEFLRSRDAVLYERLTYFKSLDPDAMHKQVADNIIEVTYGIDDCIDTYSYAYLYSYFPAVSANYIQRYISLIINFFKSWKVHLLGINTIYKFNDPNENTVKILECMDHNVKFDEIRGNVFVYGDLKINPLDAVNPSGIPYIELYPDLYLITDRYNDKYEVKDRLRLIIKTGNYIHFSDNFSNIHIVFDDENTYPLMNTEDNHELVIRSQTAGFTVADTNELIMNNDDDEQTVWDDQLIDTYFNNDSYDIIEWKENQDDE